MTITVTPLGDTLIAEHWSSRIVTTLTPGMGPDAVRRAMLEPMSGIADGIHSRVRATATDECYTKGAPSMIEVAPRDAEFAYGVAAPGRPGQDEGVLVDLPPMNQEVRYRSDGRIVGGAGRPEYPVTRNTLTDPVMDDAERLVVIALTHFRLIAAGHAGTSLKAASADYREGTVVTSDGRSGDILWWVGHASTLGVKIPTAKKLIGRFTNAGELIFTPRQKQVS